MVEAGELNHPQDSGPSTEKALDSSTKIKDFCRISTIGGTSKRREKSLVNLQSADRAGQSRVGEVTKKFWSVARFS